MAILFTILTLFLTSCKGDSPSSWELPVHKRVFDQHLYEKVLDQELCSQQVQYLVRNDTETLLKFFDAGIRTPRGIMEKNLYSVDLGDYDQCLGIRQEMINSSTIEGKYCSIELPLMALNKLPGFPDFLRFNIPETKLNSTISLSSDDQKLLIQYEGIRKNSGLTKRMNPFISTLNVAVCLPKTCTTRQFLREVTGFDPASVGTEFTDLYCRLPNDKQWVVADYVAIAIFSLLLVCLVISTIYDVYQSEILKNDSKTLNQIYKSFSIYTNSRQLFNYKSILGAIECLDGIRTFSMIGVIVCHTYHNQLADNLVNPIEVLRWLASPEGLLVTMSRISVDTFFLMSGLLVVYSTLGKTSKSQFVRDLPIFYFNRVMRILPVLASMILLKASLLNHIFDGPDWTVSATEVEKCRVNWWVNLLFLQNWIAPNEMCLINAWYLSVDMQLYLLSPLVLFWLIGEKKSSAWWSLVAALKVSIVGATAYNFYIEVPASSYALARLQESKEYFRKYYVNTLTRSSPFVIGMIYGYVLHLYRNNGLRISKIQVGVSWCATFVSLGFIMWINRAVLQIDWDNQTVDSLVNSFMRPAWALAVGWIVVACHHGYGGPINWFLSLRCFKVLSRLSYTMYIVHFPFIHLVNSTRKSVAFFSPAGSAFKFLGDFTLAFIVAYILTMLVDAPCANLVKWFMACVRVPCRRPPPPKEAVAESSSGGYKNGAYINDKSKKSAL